jgi:hypothetical protein
VGQPVAVTRLPSSRPGLLRFEANRSLTGMGHEHYHSLEDATGTGSAPMLARRLLETGQVDSVHVYSNIVTVDLHKGYSGESLDPIIEDLYIYYRPGFVPPPLEMPEEEAPAATGGGEGASGDAAVDAAASAVPAHLLERSRLAKERWLAKQG